MRIRKQKPAQRERRMRTIQKNDQRRPHEPRERGYDRKKTSSRTNERIVVPRRSTLRFVPMILAAIVIIGSIFYIFILSSSSQARVQFSEDFMLENEQAREHIWGSDFYRTATDEVLASSWLNRSKLTVRSGAVTSHIESTSPEVLHASLRMSVVDDTPIIHIVPREPVILLETLDGSRYLIDNNGISIARVDEDKLQHFNELLQIVDQVGLEAEPGSRVLPSETVSFISKVIYQFDAFEIDVERALLPAAANELQVQPKDTSIVGKFDITQEHRWQAGTFIATYRQLKDNDELPDEYIDARVEGRVYYR